MAINTTHALYDEFAPAMKRTCDAYDGKVQQYVPKLTGQSADQYDAYVNRSSYYNVVERTLSALIGALTRKTSRIEGVEPRFAGDLGVEEFITQCYADMFKTGRVGLMVDFDESLNSPVVINYSGESIINWGDDFVVLMETYFAADPKDKYNQLLLTRYRELFIDDMGFYAVHIWEQKKTAAGNYSNVKPQYEVVETIEPTVRGQRFTFLPFVVANATGIGMGRICRPPLATLADINIDHFKIAVDIGHAAHFIALPTPYITGDIQGESQFVRLGTDQFIHLTQGSTTGFLEFSGAGMSFLTELAKTKEEQMYSLGSRMLQYKRGVESSDSLQIRLGAEGAALIGVATALEEALCTALYWYNMWMGVDSEPEVELNKDVSPVALDPSQVASLLSLYQQGVITLDTLIKRLYEGEIVDDINEEKAGLGQPVETTPEMDDTDEVRS